LSNNYHSKSKSSRYYHKYTCLRVTYPLFSSDFNETWISTDFWKSSNIKFHENPSSGRRIFHVDMKKIIADFRKDVHTYRKIKNKLKLTLQNVHGEQTHLVPSTTRICINKQSVQSINRPSEGRLRNLTQNGSQVTQQR
jgi:hypothetical protein